jgi:predicted MFS family arabinose efflux permease
MSSGVKGGGAQSGIAEVNPAVAGKIGNSFNFSRSYRNYVLFVLTLVYTVNYIDRYIFSMLLQDVKVELVLTDFQLGILQGFAFAVFYAFLSIPIARLADRFNRRNIIAICISLWSLMTAACGLAANFIALLLARMGVGIGEAGASPPSHAIISDYFAARERATALAIFSSGIMLAVFMGFSMGGWLNDNFGWRYTLVIAGLPGIFVGLLTFLTVREPPRGHADGALPPAPSNLRETLSYLAHCRTFLLLSFAGSMQAFVGYSVLSWLPAYFERVHGLSSTEIGAQLGIAVLIGGLLGTIPGGYVSDRLAKRDLRWYLWLSAIGMFAGMAAMQYCFIANDPLPAFISFAFAAGLLNICLGPMFTVCQGVAPVVMRSSATAIMLLIIDFIGMGFGPPVVGKISDLLEPTLGEQSLRYALMLVSCSPLLSGLLFWLTAGFIHRDFQVAHPGRRLPAAA